MVKKILIGVVFAGFIGLLVFGAVNRTIAKSGNDVSASIGKGEGTTEQEHEGNLESSRGGGVGNGEQSGNGGGRNSRQSETTGEVAAVEWFEFQATVTSVESDMLTLTSKDGQTIEVAGRPWRYAQEQGFVPQVNDQLVLKGFYDANGRLEVAEMSNLSNQAGLSIRDANGRPAWAGQSNSQY